MKSKTTITILLFAFVLTSCQTVTPPHVNSTETPVSNFVLFTETVEPIITTTSLQTQSSTELPLDINVFVQQSTISPSGKWLAQVMMTRVNNGSGNKDSFALMIINQENFAEQVVEKIDVQRLMGYSIPWALAWSENEEHLYYTHRFGGSDGCFNDDDFFGSDLYKVTLESGESIQLAPDLGYWLALSPNQTSVAYLTSINSIKIRNIETSKEQEISIQEQLNYPDSILTRSSHLIWSPNGEELIFTLEVNVCADEDNEKSSIIKINAETMSQKTIVFESPDRLISLEWSDDGQVLVQDENDSYWWLNPFNGQMVEKQ